MRHHIFLPLLCAACAPTGADEPPETPSTPAPVATATPEPVRYATQIEVPSPNYAAMVPDTPIRAKGVLTREPTARPPADAKAVGDLWLKRLQARNATFGHGLSGKTEDSPVSSISVSMPAREFDAWVAQNGWTVPKHIRWDFVPELVAPRVSEAAAPKIRYWPARTTRTGAQNQAALSARIFLRDGCFWLQGYDGSEKLAWFLAETGVDVDDQGYLVLVDRNTGQTSARVGEWVTWAGPNADPTPEQTHELRRRCGDHPVADAGNPEANRRMYVTYPHLRDDWRAEPPPPPKPR